MLRLFWFFGFEKLEFFRVIYWNHSKKSHARLKMQNKNFKTLFTCKKNLKSSHFAKPSRLFFSINPLKHIYTISISPKGVLFFDLWFSKFKKKSINQYNYHNVLETRINLKNVSRNFEITNFMLIEEKNRKKLFTFSEAWHSNNPDTTYEENQYDLRNSLSFLCQWCRDWYGILGLA